MAPLTLPHRLPLLLALLALLGSAAAADGTRPPRRPLVLVSVDGFRADYLTWYPKKTSFLRSLVPLGVHVARMKPEFVTKTFPNHWTIATGLYQESHGIVSNKMWDPVFREYFNTSTREEKWWNASRPIWISVRAQGLRSATFFWPGSEVAFNGMRQNHFYDYKDAGKFDFDYRVQKVLDWVTKDGVDLAVMYLDQPDSAGHKFGPESVEVQKALKLVDDTIRALFQGLKDRGFQDKVNVLIVSDHGMTAVSKNKTIDMGDRLAPVAEILDRGPLLAMNPKPRSKIKQLLDILRDENNKRGNRMRVFTKETLPERYHYGNNRRTPEILVLPNEGYMIRTSTTFPDRGVHGFDNEYEDMQVPMFAVGPSFRKNVSINGFRQVDIYGLACHLLGIQAQPNNGSLRMLDEMLISVTSDLPRLTCCRWALWLCLLSSSVGFS